MKNAHCGFTPTTENIMHTISQKLPAITTALLGGLLFIFGLNGFLHFIPMPPPQGAAGAFMGGLFASGYFFSLLALTEMGVGLALLLRRFVPLALVILAPVTVNIVAYHVFLDPKGLPMALFVLAANAGLAYYHREAFAPLFATPEKRPANATLATAS